MTKKLLWLFPVIVIGYFFFTGQDFKGSDDRKWSLDPRMTKLVATNDYAPLPVVKDVNFVHSTQTRIIHTPYEVMSVTPNVRLYPTTNTHQSEVIITRHPTNQNIMFASANMTTIGGSLFISEGVYVTTNSGTSWFGNDTLTGAPIGNHGGDPGPAIDHNGRFYMSHLGFTTSGMFANYSTNNGSTWSNTFTIASGSQDKNFTAVDDDPSSPFYGRAYTVWSLFTAANPPIAVSRTTDGGVTWSAAQQVNTPPPGHYSQGVDIRVGPSGSVNLIWTAPISGTPFTGDFCGFAKSTNGGVNWAVRDTAFDINGIRNSSFGTYGIRTNDFPRIDIDRSGGARNGWIYVVVAEKSPGSATDAADVILYRSSNGGTNWSSGIRVNQDAPGNGKLQFFPAVRVDEFGGVNVVYYDNRNTAADSAEVYMGRSLDGGNTWSEVIVSDHRFRPRAIVGLAGGYSGDYIGITSANAKIWPVWMDNSTGNYQIWTAGINIANYPLNAFNLQSPAPSTIVTSLPGSNTPVTFNWDTSATGASYKWIFGSPTTTPRLITMPSGSNSITMTLGQLDAILAGLGVAQGNQLVGQWDVWATRPNPPANDSLKAANGPRAVTLRRGTPTLSAFNLSSPANNTTITTSGFNNSPVNFQWTRSGAGTNYKWKFGSPTIGTVVFNIPSNSGGNDSLLTLINSGLDVMLAGAGVLPGDSLVGQWAVWAYNASDSLKSTQTFNITLKRQAKGDVLVAYDSTIVACRTSRDSVTSNLNQLGITYDLYNRGTQTGSSSITFRGYKKVIVLGEGTSSFSTVIKDSLIAYMNSGGTTVGTKSKVIIFSEDVGYNYARSGSTYQDLNFTQNILGFDWISDRPASGAAQGLVGDVMNPGLADSTVGSWPDVIKIHTGTGTHTLDRFRRHITNPDSANGVGSWRTNYNVAVIGVDLESLRPSVGGPTGSPHRRFIKGALDYVDQITVGTEPISSVIPDRFALYQNYPNPFNPATTIKFDIPKQSLVTIKIYDVAGREVAQLLNNVQHAPGAYDMNFNASHLASGVYFYRIQAGDFVEIKKMMLIK